MRSEGKETGPGGVAAWQLKFHFYRGCCLNKAKSFRKGECDGEKYGVCDIRIMISTNQL